MIYFVTATVTRYIRSKMSHEPPYFSYYFFARLSLVRDDFVGTMVPLICMYIIQTVGALRMVAVSTSNHRISLEYMMNNRLVMLCVETPLPTYAPKLLYGALLDLGTYFR